MRKDENIGAGSGFDPEALTRKYAEERAKRLRSDGNAQYQPLSEQFASDPHVEPGFSRTPIEEQVEVFVIGAGFGGLLAAAQLRQHQVNDIRIIDKAGDFGGTWYWNRYPGAACDIESYIYMPLLEELGYIPTEKYAKSPEIYEHCRRIADHFGLYPQALFQTEVTDLRWDEGEGLWIVSTNWQDRISARFVIVAGGFLSKPKLPAIPGIEDFKGHSFHTSRWDYSYTGGSNRGGLTGLAGKRVAVIGTGASALQCIPFLAQDVGQLYVFQRTPSSIDVRGNCPTDPEWVRSLEPGWRQRRVENFESIVSGVHQEVDLVADSWTDILGSLAFFNTKLGPVDPEEMRVAALAKMEKVRQRVAATVKDPATAEALKPYYNYLCKRPGFNDEYLATFNRPNVTLVDTDGKGVERITSDSVVVAGKEYPMDCIIYATGFEFLTEYASQVGFEIQGREGVTLTEKWSQGTRTLYGMQTRGFPNLFILGFSQNGISANLTYLAEERANHLGYIINRCVEQGIRTVEPTQEAEDAWVEELMEKRVVRRAFLASCTPSYYNQEGLETPATALNDIYGGGFLKFIQILKEWRAEDELRGLELTFLRPAATSSQHRAVTQA